MARKRKTTIRTTNAENRRAEARADARRDRKPAPTQAGILPSLAEWRAARDLLTEAELLKLARSAARLELRGAMFSADDRLDVAAHIVAAVLTETSGALPRRQSPRVTLGRLCGDAKNARRSIEAARERDRIDSEARATDAALAPDALGIDSTPARHVAIIGRASVAAAKRAASAVCADLGLPADDAAPHWSVFYVWTRGVSPEQCAAELGVTWGAFRVRMSRGAKFVRGFYSARELVGRLTLGARHDVDTDSLVYVLEDASREAHGHTPLLASVADAPHWRDRQTGDAEVTRRRMPGRDRVHWRRRREHRAEHTAQVADSLAKIGRYAAQDASRRGAREKSAPSRSALPTRRTEAQTG